MEPTAQEWRPMSTAPRNATNIEVSTELGRTTIAHWAEGDGSDQPRFQGWFEAIKKSDGKVSHFVEIETPEAWRPVQASGDCYERHKVDKHS